MFKLKKLLKNIKGSEVVEKMMMVIASVTLFAVGIGFMNKFINSAIENQIGDNSHQIELPNGNASGNIGGNTGGQGGTVTPKPETPGPEGEDNSLLYGTVYNDFNYKKINTNNLVNAQGELIKNPIIAEIKNELYVMGGVDTSRAEKPNDKIYKYNLSTNNFDFFMDMPSEFLTQKYAMSLALTYNVVNDKLYVFGGGPTGNFNEVLKFDPSAKTFEIVATYPDNIAKFSTTVVKDDTIYCFGGFDLQTQTIYDSIYSFDTNNNTFTKETDAKYNTALSAGALVGNKIYLFGGLDRFTNETLSTSIIEYNITTKTLTKVGDLPVGLASFSVVNIDNILYVIGGQDTTSDTYASKKIYSFDTRNMEVGELNNTFGNGTYGQPVAIINNKIYTMPYPSSDVETELYEITLIKSESNIGGTN